MLLKHIPWSDFFRKVKAVEKEQSKKEVSKEKYTYLEKAFVL